MEFPKGSSGPVVTPVTDSVTKVSRLTKPGFTGTTPLLLSPEAAATSDNAEPVEVATKKTEVTEAPPLPLPSVFSSSVTVSPPGGFFIPKDVFGKPGSDPKKATLPDTSALLLPKTMPLPTIVAVKAEIPSVLIYASPTTRAYFSAGGVDAAFGAQAWEALLRKYKVPYEVLMSVEQLEVRQTGALILPSAVALSERERLALAGFRRRGGSILASWLTGVRSENGAWRGFDFMENTLGTRVVGTTEPDEDDTFLIPHGDSPVAHQLPAGLRVWMERTAEWYPLRLLGRNSAAQLMDWSRALATTKQSSAITFDERDQPSGKKSRTVVLGFPERLWLSADAQALEAIATDALRWVMRQPDAYIAAWPAPYASAFVLAIDAADTMVDANLNYGKLVGDLGGHASYYVLADESEKSAPILKKIQMNGHEVAYLGDRFEGFKELSTNNQAKRLDSMLQAMKASGIELAENAGFHPPMESYDKTTEKLLKERGFGYIIGGLDTSETRLPSMLPSVSGAPNSKSGKAMVLLPRTQSDPEDLIAEGDASAGMQLFLKELDLAQKMGGVSVVRISNRSALTDLQFAEISRYLKAKRDRLWMATAAQVAEWWRERERVTSRLDATVVPPLLTVSIKGDTPLQHAVNVWINLPDSDKTLRLVAVQNYEKPPQIGRIDTWRYALALQGFAPGEYRWHLFFDSAVVADTKSK